MEYLTMPAKDQESEVATDRVMSPHDLIRTSMTIEELILAVRVIGYLKSFNPEIGVRESDYWIRQMLVVTDRSTANIVPACQAYVTRRYGLRQRICELLSLTTYGCAEPDEEEKSASLSISSIMNEGYLQRKKRLKGAPGKKYRKLFALIEAAKVETRSQLIDFLRKVFLTLGAHEDIPDDACDECLRMNLMDAIILAHPDHHQNSEKSMALEPEYNRLVAIFLGLRARLAGGKI